MSGGGEGGGGSGLAGLGYFLSRLYNCYITEY